jgi:hypothetical protein
MAFVEVERLSDPANSQFSIRRIPCWAIIFAETFQSIFRFHREPIPIIAHNDKDIIFLSTFPIPCHEATELNSTIPARRLVWIGAFCRMHIGCNFEIPADKLIPRVDS